VERLILLSNGAPVSALLLIAILASSLVGLMAAPQWIEKNLFRPYWLVPQREYATLVTSAFIHADFAHLLFNGFTFWAFAFALERAIGSVPFLALYAVGLLASNLGTYFKHRGEPDYRSLGASGAILAVLFASILYNPGGSIFILPIPLPIPAPLFALAYLGYSYYASRQGRGRINHDAHLYGALAGIAFVLATEPEALVRALHQWFR
jgi:membrane associated rhomboid family serine protease